MLQNSIPYIAASMKGQGDKSPGCFIPGKQFPGTESHLEPSLAKARNAIKFTPFEKITISAKATVIDGSPNRKGELRLLAVNVMQGTRQENAKRLKRDNNLNILDFALLKDAVNQHFDDTLRGLGDDDWVLAYLAWVWGNESVPIKDNDSLRVVA